MTLTASVFEVEVNRLFCTGSDNIPPEFFASEDEEQAKRDENDLEYSLCKTSTNHHRYILVLRV
jgi:hypothetical protein